MKALVFAIALVASIAHHSVYAHKAHGIDENKAVAIVYEAIPQLTTKDLGYEVGRLDESWNSITESDVAMVETDGDFYVMQATNYEKEMTIFFLIGINGKVLDAKNSNDF